MGKADPTTQEPTRSEPSSIQGTRPNGHDLVAVTEWLPGLEPTAYDVDLTGGTEYETRFWRCRKCGQERTRREAFGEPCAVDRLPSPVMDGGYSIDDPRTRRALSEDMAVRFGERGATYTVDSESGNTYRVDVEAETCTCPDYEKREVFCKHQRRVDLEIRAGTVPGPDGTFVR